MHSGHRGRMRGKMLSGQNIPPHEILEMMLAYAIPRKNTNDIAHRLLDQFGSLEGVFSASYEDLLNVRGIGEQSAFFIYLTSLLHCNLYGRVRMEDLCLDSVGKLERYGEFLFRGAVEESIYVALLDSRLCLVECFRLAGGTSSCAEVGIEDLLGIPSVKKSTSAVIFHNHPGGILEVSDEDRDFAVRIAELLAMEGVEVIENIVVAGERSRVILCDSREAEKAVDKEAAL